MTIICKDKEAVKAIRPYLWTKWIIDRMLLIGAVVGIYYLGSKAEKNLTTRTDLPGMEE